MEPEKGTANTRRKILITGASNGIGKGAVLILAQALPPGSELILLCRSSAAGKAIIEVIKRLAPHCSTTLLLCDLTKMRAVKAAITEVTKKYDHLDALFINAGIGYAARRIETEDGMDAHFQVNYLAQFMLTLRLLPLLEKSNFGGRIIFNATHFGQIFWDDMQLQNDWTYEKAIFQSMAAKRMFLRYLHHLYRQIPESRLSFIGYQVRKTVWSNQLNIIPKTMKMMASLVKLFGGFISVEDSGRDMLPLFLENETLSVEKSGKLITSKKNLFPEIAESNEILDEHAQEKLWQISLELCNDEEARNIATQIKSRTS